MKKPDATTVITEENYRERVWPLPVNELLYVGPATFKQLAHFGIRTIGDLAHADRFILAQTFGKHGEILHTFANGQDTTPVAREGDAPPPKSVGNSTTTARDIVSEEDAKWVFMMLAETVGQRMRAQGLRGSEIQIWIRDSEMFGFERQTRLEKPTDLDSEIGMGALALFREAYGWMRPVRGLGIRVGRLSYADTPEQLSLFDDPMREKCRAVERAVDALRGRFGDACVRRAYLLTDDTLSEKPHKEYKPFDVLRQG